MEKFMEPEMEVVAFEEDDVIATSAGACPSNVDLCPTEDIDPEFGIGCEGVTEP